MTQGQSYKIYLPLLTLALLVGCSDKKETVVIDSAPPVQVAAKVNGVALSEDQVNLALKRAPELNSEQSKAASIQVIRTLVDQEVVAQKAVADKIDNDPEVVHALQASRRQILAEAYMSRKLGTAATPTDAEVSEYFDKHPELFAKRKIYRLQELSIQAPKERQEEIRTRLLGSRSLDDFSEWLKQENFPTKAAQGVKSAEQLPLELLPKLAEMPDGQAIVVNAPDGLLVILLADSQMQPVNLEQSKPAISRLLQVQARQKAAKAELDSLKATAKIEYLGKFAEAAKLDAAPAPEKTPAAQPATAPAANGAESAPPASPPAAKPAEKVTPK